MDQPICGVGNASTVSVGAGINADSPTAQVWFSCRDAEPAGASPNKGRSRTRPKESAMKKGIAIAGFLLALVAARRSHRGIQARRRQRPGVQSP